MKNFKSLFLSALIGLSFLVTSCDGDNEPLDPALLNVPITVDNCSIPTNLATSPLNNGASINLSWSSTGSVTSWQVEYGLSDSYIQGAGTKVNANATTVTINNLFAINSYTFSVRAVCGTGFGDWSAPKNVVGVNPNCANPSLVSAIRNSNPSEVTVNWTAASSQTSWEISYGAPGYNPVSGTNFVQTTTKPKVISGLAITSYDIYVRAKCSITENSSWVGPINVPAVTSSSTGIVGNYLLTGFTSSTPTDINADGVSTNNVLSETTCFNNLFLKLLQNNTFTLDSKGADIDITIVNNVEVETIGCFTDPIETGSWVLNGTTLTLDFTSAGPNNDYTYNPVNNTLSATVNNGAIVGTTSQGSPITLTTDLTFTFTKQ
jgi:Fibronectin type III domain